MDLEWTWNGPGMDLEWTWNVTGIDLECGWNDLEYGGNEPGIWLKKSSFFLLGFHLE
jgi:hypothetical protein